MTEVHQTVTVAGGYARQSDDDPEGIALQWRIIEEYARTRNWIVPQDPGFRFSDDGVSGERLSRPDYDRLKAVVSSRAGSPFSVLIVRRPDRLGRWKDVRRRPSEELFFADHGVQIVYTNDTVERVNYSNVSDPRVAVQSITDVLTSVTDAQELGRLRERSTSRRREYAMQGFWVFSNSVPYGTERWIVDTQTRQPIRPMPERGTLRIPNGRCRLRWKTDGTADVVREIYRRVTGGESLLRVADLLNKRSMPTPLAVSPRRTGRLTANLWAHSGIRKIIANPIYFGAFVFGASTSDDYDWRSVKTLPLGDASFIHSPAPFLVRDFMESALVSEDEWWRANEAVSGRDWAAGRPRRRSGAYHLLSGIARCAHCCCTILTRRRKFTEKAYRYYVHRNDNEDVLACPNAKISVSADTLEEATEEVFLDALTSPTLVHTVSAMLQRSLDSVVSGEVGHLALEAERELELVRKRIRQTVAALSEFPESSIVSREAKSALKALEAKAALFEHRIQSLETQESRWAGALKAVLIMQRDPKSLRELYTNADHFTKRAMLRAVIDEVLLDGVTGTMEVRVRPFGPHQLLFDPVE
jgi:DNA invertase Pin-like site-specific DNA recombinase